MLKIQRLAFFSILITYALIVFGGYVASSESGMGCGPEWPLCNGDVIPSLKGDTLIEFSHRVIGAVLGIISLTLFMKILRTKADPSIRIVAYWMISLLTLQVILGALVVLLDLPSIIVTSHLIIAMLFLATLIWIWRNTDEKVFHQKNRVSTFSNSKIIRHLDMVLVILILTLAFGAYTKHELYGLSCGWLACGQTFLPNNTSEIIQSIHRSLAVLSAIYILILTYWSYIKGWESHLQHRLLLATFTILVQIAAGVMTIVTYIDIPWAVIHLAVGTFLFAFITEARVFTGSIVYQSRKNNVFIVRSKKTGV